MRLRKFIVFSLTLVFLHTVANAQSQSIAPMSPQEYRSMVNSLSNQNQNNLSQQVTQQYGPPSSATIDTTPTAPIPINQPSTSTIQPAESVAAPIPNTPVNPTPVPPPPPTTVRPTTSTPPSSLSTPSSLAPQNQPYTGFGKPNDANNNKNSSSSGSTSSGSSGWNIRY